MSLEPRRTPAIVGGPRAKTTPYGRSVRYGEEELTQLREAIDQQTLFYTAGAKVKALEARFAELNGVAHAVATSSGTASIHAALMALGISPGDEVIVSPITDMGSVIPILFQGAAPVFADLDGATATLDPASVRERITDRTRAVLAVHLAGGACDLAALGAICDERGIDLVEDCAQAFGCAWQGRPIGTVGRIGCFSMNEFKHISCGDGGIVVTNDDELAVRLRLATDKAYDRRPGVAMRNPTFLAANYRITELQAAVALAQLEKLEGIVARRRAWCGALNRMLVGTPGIRLPAAVPGCDPSWWFYLMQVVPEELGADADEFAAALSAEGVGVGAHYIGLPVYGYPVFTEHCAYQRGAHAYQARSYGPGLCPEAERILRDCVMLGVNEGYTETDLLETAEGIRKVADWLANGRA
ncbi:MAG: DegT/DnrJ/EryC1/StrS family aminotransferase [Armatimonadetes bacterium]|nr:DegT/DnrJ/EryC1/StrS family aminotransferase [Armatimonadota bacterium]